MRRFKDRPLGKATMNDSTLTLTDTLRGPVEKPMRLLALGLCMEALFLYIRYVVSTAIGI